MKPPAIFLQKMRNLSIYILDVGLIGVKPPKILIYLYERRQAIYDRKYYSSYSFDSSIGIFVLRVDISG